MNEGIVEAGINVSYTKHFFSFFDAWSQLDLDLLLLLLLPFTRSHDFITKTPQNSIKYSIFKFVTNVPYKDAHGKGSCKSVNKNVAVYCGAKFKLITQAEEDGTITFH